VIRRPEEPDVSALIAPSDDRPASNVVPYIRFLERRAWRAKIAADLRDRPGAPSSAERESAVLDAHALVATAKALPCKT
jgi:hypothetical protein